MATTYYDLVQAVKAYYGQGDQWLKIAQGNLDYDVLRQVPGVDLTVSQDGTVLGWSYNNPFPVDPEPTALIDSNLQTGSYGLQSFDAQIPGTATTDPGTGITTMRSGATVTSTGNVLMSIADRASLAIAGVSLGCKLGKSIDSAIYAFNPDWWDEHYPAINPETWDTLASTDFGKGAIRALFGLKNDDNTVTTYIDERMLAYTYLTLLANGGYTTGQLTPITIQPGDRVTQNNIVYGLSQDIVPMVIPNPSDAANILSDSAFAPGTVVIFNGRNIFPCSEYKNFTVTVGTQIDSHGYNAEPQIDVGSGGSYGYGALILIHIDNNAEYTGWSRWNGNIPTRYNVATPGNTLYDNSVQNQLPVYSTYKGLQGVSDNPNASIHIDPDDVINPTTGNPVTPADNLDDVLQALKTAYPDLFNDSVYEDIPQEDGTIKRVTYIPTPYPAQDSQGNPITDPDSQIDPQTHPEIDPETTPQDIIDNIVDTVTEPPTPPDTGGGNTPPVVIPPGSTSALYSIYNPSQGELSSFGAWLWSSNFVDQLLKLFADPMQAIIGLHKVFVPPVISGRNDIKVGYLNSGVNANVVSQQYVTVDCGTVSLPEYFGNALDYDPFTDVSIYLPFVGIHNLNVSDILRSQINVKYRVDVLTGACLAEITVTRDVAGGVLYTYSGICAVTYPVSSGSYMGVIASIASIAGGVIGTVASGGAMAPMAMGAVSGALNARTRVAHSGSFSGNAGAMGCKKPYLIISRPQNALAQDFNQYVGLPANKTVKLSDCNGFIRCDSLHMDGVPALKEELEEIEYMLKEGVIL